LHDPPQQDVYLDLPREDVAPYIPSNARSALEVGCGKGGFGTTLRQRLGAEARLVGVEAHPDQARIARAGHGFDEVVSGYFPVALADRNEKFDAVFFIDVLEHVLDPWTMLQDVHGFLTARGAVVAAIPSIQYAPVVRALLRGGWDSTETGTLDRTHLRFFTRAIIIEMFEGAGYRVVDCQGANSAWNTDWWKRTLKRRMWLRLMPDSEWLHFMVVAVPHGRPDPAPAQSH